MKTKYTDIVAVAYLGIAAILFVCAFVIAFSVDRKANPSDIATHQGIPTIMWQDAQGHLHKTFEAPDEMGARDKAE